MVLMLPGNHPLLALVVMILGLTIRLELVLQEPELASLPFPVTLHHLLLHAAVVDQQDGLRQHGRLVRVVLRVERPRRVGQAVAGPISGSISGSNAWFGKLKNLERVSNPEPPRTKKCSCKQCRGAL